MSKKTWPSAMNVRDAGLRQGGLVEPILDICGNGVDNHILLLKKKVCLRQCNPPDKIYGFGGTDIKLKTWDQTDWVKFKETFLKCARAWHKRFVIVPPDNESELDYSTSWVGGFKYMPNVECHLEVSLVDASGDPHDLADVAMLEPGASDQSDQTRLNNTDMGQGGITKQTFTNPDRSDGVIKSFSVLAHEFGHMLGQPHIGVLKSTKDCQDAQDGKIPSGKEYYFKGGTNSGVCYGWTGDTENTRNLDNIMGGGNTFDVVNAGPWKNALAQLLQKPNGKLPEGWSVIVTPNYKSPRQIR